MSEKDVKDAGGSSSAVKDEKQAQQEKDERGVSWENRAKEYERKLAEATAEREELKAKLSETTRTETKRSDVDKQEAAKQRLAEFVEDPEAFITRAFKTERYREELPEALKWLKSQPGYQDGDLERVNMICKDYGIAAESPRARANAAWKILSEERLRKEFNDLTQEKERKGRAADAAADGPGRSTDTSGKPSRAELLKELAAAQKKNDRDSMAVIMSKLEDTPRR